MIWFAVLLLLAKPVGYVNDFAGIISEAQEAELETRLESFTASTGNELAVVTLKSLEGDTIENTAVAVFEQWGIGQKGKDNGVLLLIAPNERELKIEVGYGLEPVLTDSRAGTIIRDVITPKFKQDDYEGGITDGAEALITVLTSDAAAFDQPTVSQNSSFSFLPLVVILLFIYAAAFLGRSKRIWPGGAIGLVIGLLFFSVFGAIIVGLLGLLLDFIFSKNFQVRKAKGLPTSWKSSWGGFSAGKSGGGFGGFSGGSSGGGGASGRW